MAGMKTLKAGKQSGLLPGPPLVPGFQSAGIHAGIKSNRAKDLALIVSQPPARVAGLFTQNRLKAASVLLSQARVRSGLCRAVIVNSGNANACTGDRGMKDAIEICQKTAKRLDTDEGSILISSTGVIGERLPCRRIRRSRPPRSCRRQRSLRSCNPLYIRLKQRRGSSIVSSTQRRYLFRRSFVSSEFPIFHQLVLMLRCPFDYQTQGTRRKLALKDL